MPVTLTFDFINRIIEVAAPDTEVTIQDLINQIRDTEDELSNMNYPKIADASGKEDLGGGVKVGITLKLLNWKLKFEDRAGPDYVLCNVTGGNLVAVDANNVFVNPIEPASYVTVTKTSSASATIAELEIEHLKRYIESGRIRHAAYGDTYYWNPIDGDDAYDGTSPERAVKTFAQAHTLCTDGNHDVIFLIATDPSGLTTVDEQLSFTKDFVSLRGSGRDILIKPTATTGDTISISATGVYISGMQVETADSGTTQNCVSINSGAENAHLEGMWIKQAPKHGVVIDNAKYADVIGCVIEHNGGDGVEIKGSNGKEALIKNCSIWDNGVGICCEDGANENIFENNMIHDNTLGIKLTATATHTYIRASNSFTNNTTLIDDQGVDNYFEEVVRREKQAGDVWTEATTETKKPLIIE